MTGPAVRNVIFVVDLFQLLQFEEPAVIVLTQRTFSAIVFLHKCEIVLRQGKPVDISDHLFRFFIEHEFPEH